MSASTSNQDKVNTLAHLVNTTGHHISHSIRHLRQLEHAVTPEQRKFNMEHLSIHLDGAAEHVQKLINHIKDNYPAEAKELAQLEATIPVSGKPSNVEQRNAIIKKAAALARGSGT